MLTGTHCVFSSAISFLNDKSKSSCITNLKIGDENSPCSFSRRLVRFENKKNS